MGPLLIGVLNNRHLEVVAALIFGLEAARGTSINTSNIELLVDLLVGDLIHEVLNSGIEIARELLTVSLEGNLGLRERRVNDSMKKMPDPGTGVICNIISLLREGQHALICVLVALDAGRKGKPTFGPLYRRF